MKLFITTTLLIGSLFILPQTTFAQKTFEPADLIGLWEIQGVLMGDDDSAYLLPHKNSSPDCKDHSVFTEDHLGKEVQYKENCESNKKEFSWEIEGDMVILKEGDKTRSWHIKSIEGNTMTIGVQVRPNSENRLYAVFKKME